MPSFYDESSRNFTSNLKTKSLRLHIAKQLILLQSNITKNWIFHTQSNKSRFHCQFLNIFQTNPCSSFYTFSLITNFIEFHISIVNHTTNMWIHNFLPKTFYQCKLIHNFTSPLGENTKTQPPSRSLVMVSTNSLQFLLPTNSSCHSLTALSQLIWMKERTSSLGISIIVMEP